MASHSRDSSQFGVLTFSEHVSRTRSVLDISGTMMLKSDFDMIELASPVDPSKHTFGDDWAPLVRLLSLEPDWVELYAEDPTGTKDCVVRVICRRHDYGFLVTSPVGGDFFDVFVAHRLDQEATKFSVGRLAGALPRKRFGIVDFGVSGTSPLFLVLMSYAVGRKKTNR